MTAFCNNHNIQQILSSSHHPSANGKVERKNREIRKKIKAGFIRQILILGMYLCLEIIQKT